MLLYSSRIILFNTCTQAGRHAPAPMSAQPQAPAAPSLSSSARLATSCSRSSRCKGTALPPNPSAPGLTFESEQYESCCARLGANISLSCTRVRGADLKSSSVLAPMESPTESSKRAAPTGRALWCCPAYGIYRWGAKGRETHGSSFVALARSAVVGAQYPRYSSTQCI